MIDIAPFHLQFVEFCCRFIMGISVVPILDEVLFEFFPDIDVGRSRYGSSHDPIFYTLFPFGDGASLYKCECVRDFLIRVSHDWCGGVEKLIELEFVHELVGFCSISGEGCVLRSGVFFT